MAACPACGKELPAGEFPFCPFCTEPLTGGGREQRKTVTVLFCDVTGSTALGESTDPEALRALLARYFERMRAIVESHGGTVEKFIGDAVMAVFGVPVAHEDDALRACRAAVEMRDALPDLGVEARIGVNTGEVVTGTEERLVTGDPVNVAAGFEQAAERGEILIGEATLRLVRDVVEVESVPPLRLKGKAQLLSAQRLMRVLPPREQRHEGVFVGRGEELERLRELWASVDEGGHCQLVTAVASPGVGKSRLVEEFVRGLDSLVVRGRCPPYGEGITYWPVVETLKQLGPPPVSEEVDRVLSAILGADVAATSEEIAWAYRKTLEHVAREQPLVVVFDDLQWGEETFLNLVEHVALLSSGASILILCMARPELLDRRPSWRAEMHLDPLSETEIARLIAQRVPDDLRERIVRIAGGVPLFAEEMVSMNAESTGEVAVPGTLQALLAARLDQLDPTERRILECASIEGEIFHRGAVQALAPEERQVTSRLASLVRRELVFPDRAQIPGEDGFRFRHLLLRDAAYDAIAKTTRADLHQHYADWLVEYDRSAAQFGELVGFHLEQAARFKHELGLPHADLAERAGDWLAAAGRRALSRGDYQGAAGLLQRALKLTRPTRLDVHLELDLAVVLTLPQWGAELADAAAEKARLAGDKAGEATARVVAADRRIHAGDSSVETLEKAARVALPLLEEADDHKGLVQVWFALGSAANHRGLYEEWAVAAERAIHHARLSGQSGGLFGLTSALVAGPRPADDALRTLDSYPEHRPIGRLNRALLLAMLGRFDEAWTIAKPASDQLRDFTGGSYAGEFHLAGLATLADDHEAAVGYLRPICEREEARGQQAFLASHAAQLGRSLCHVGRHDEAEAPAHLGRTLAGEDDALAQALWRQAQALVCAHHAEYAQALPLASEAVAITNRTDSLNAQGDARCDLAEVLVTAGRPAEAATELESALEQYEKKGNIVMAERTRSRLEKLA